MKTKKRKERKRKEKKRKEKKRKEKKRKKNRYGYRTGASRAISYGRPCITVQLKVPVCYKTRPYWATIVDTYVRCK